MAEEDFSKPYHGRRNLDDGIILNMGSAVAHKPVATSRQPHPYGLRKRSARSWSTERAGAHGEANDPEGRLQDLVQDGRHIQEETQQSGPELNFHSKRHFPRQADSLSPLASPSPNADADPVVSTLSRNSSRFLTTGTTSTLHDVATRSRQTPQPPRLTSSSRDWPLAPARRPPHPILSREEATIGVQDGVQDVVSIAPSRESSVASGDVGNPTADPLAKTGHPSDCIWVGGFHAAPSSHSSSPRATTEPPTTRRRSAATPTAASSRSRRTREKSPGRSTMTAIAEKITRTATATSPSRVAHWRPYPDRPLLRSRSPSPPIPSPPPPSRTAASPGSVSSSVEVPTFSTTPLAEAAFVNGREERAELVRLYKRHAGNLAKIRRDLPFGRSRPASDTERWLRILADVEQEGGQGFVLHARHRARLEKRVVQDAGNVDAGVRQEEEGLEAGDDRASGLGVKAKARGKRRNREQWMPHELDSAEEEHEGDSDAWSTDGIR